MKGIIAKINRILDNAYVYSVLAKIISVILGVIYSILFSRYLGPELRGTASVISNNSEMIMLVLCLGIYQAYPYFKKRTDKSIYMEYINYIFGIFIIYCLGCLSIALIIRPSLKICTILALIPFKFAIKELNYVVLIENPRLRNTAAIKLDIFETIFLVFLMIFTKADYNLCIIYLLVVQFVFFAIAVSNLRVNIFKIRPTLKGVWPYIKFGFVPMLTVIMMEINYKADILMMDYFKTPEAEIGIYSLGVSLAQRVWMIPDALKDILLSKLAGGKSEKEVCKVSRISLFISLIFVLGLIIFGRPFVVLLYGDEFSGAYTVLLVIILGILGMVFYKMIYSYNVINGHKNMNFVLLGMAALANIIVNAILIPSYGSIGAGIASTVSYLLCGLGFLIYFSKVTSISPLELIVLKKEDLKLLKSLAGGKKKKE